MSEGKRNALATEMSIMMIAELDSCVDAAIVQDENKNKSLSEIAAGLKEVLVARMRDVIDQNCLALVGFLRASSRDDLPDEVFEEFAQEVKERLIEINGHFDVMKKGKVQ